MPLVESDFCSPFPGLVTHTQSTTSTANTQLKIADSGSGKARAVGEDESKVSAQRPGSIDRTGTSGSPKLPSVVRPASCIESTGIETERTQVNRSTDLPSNDATTILHADLSPAEPGFGLSTSITIPGLVELDVTEPEPTALLAPSEVPETVDALLIPEKASPCSPVMKSQEVSSDTDDDVLVLDSDEEKSDWSEIND